MALTNGFDPRTSRRDLLKLGVAGLSWGMFGLGLPTALFLEEAYGLTPSAASKKYDAIIQIFLEGGPAQTDTWDPKSDPNPSGHRSLNDAPWTKTLSLGTNDIYGKPIWVTSLVTRMANLVNTDPASYGLGIVRSMHHGNGAHPIAESYMNCFWQSPVASIYPSTAAVMSQYLQGQSPLGIPSVLIATGTNGVQANDVKGSLCPAALEVQVSTNPKYNPALDMVSLPAGVDLPRYARRKAVTDVLEQSFVPAHPDSTVKAWNTAWNSAYTITTKGQARKAFDLTGVAQLPSNQNPALPRPMYPATLTLAQQLVLSGVPYVSLGIGSNDTHTANELYTTMVWDGTLDPGLEQMAKNLKASGKRVLIVMGGEFGRTPNSVAPDANGNRRDGRDHYPSGFSWTLLSINQPAFKTTAVGDTGPDGMWQVGSTPRGLVDPIYPGVMGGLLYRVMGYPVGTSPAFDVPIGTGASRPPVDATMATATARGNTPWLLQQFGLL